MIKFLKYWLIGLVGTIVIAFILIALGMKFWGNHQKSANPAKLAFMHDQATNDTPLETLKTLTAEISSVEQQNRKLAAQNQALTEQDKTTLAQFKNDVLGKVQQQMDQFKGRMKTATTPSSPIDTDDNADEDNLPDAQYFIWVSDMQGTDNDEPAKPSPKDKFAALFHANSVDKTMNNYPTADSLLAKTAKAIKPVTPYYTIPVNATLTGAIAMQPIIGRIPINGKVPDPYTFKVIIGAKNLAANGIDIPSDLQGIVASGVAEGDLLGECARGDIRSLTFVFQDGRISTTEAKNNAALGTIAAANGNPCIQGSFHTDAPLFLGVTAGLAGMQGYGNALAQAQLNHVTTAEGSTISNLLGNANTYAFGQGFSAASQAAQQWWMQRVQSSFDFVYVPNINLKTGEKLKLNINISQEIPIDYDPKARKVFYAHDSHSDVTTTLD